MFIQNIEVYNLIFIMDSKINKTYFQAHFQMSKLQLKKC